MNNRIRQQGKAFRKYIRNASQSDAFLIPDEVLKEAETWFEKIRESVKRDYEQSKCAEPVIWSEPIRHTVAWGTIDTEVFK